MDGQPSLKQKTVGALFWNLLDRLGQQGLLFVVGILVANILSVDDYALVGMLAIFTAIATILLDSGFSAALIQKKDTTEEEFSSVFWFNLGISWVIYLLLAASSPLIAVFFKQPMLVKLSLVIFLAIPINSLTIIQTTILNKKIQFKTLTKINLIAMTISGLSSLGMAIAGLGVWTLALQPVILACVRACLLWIESSWRPSWIFNFRVIKNLFGFASSLLLASLINTCFLNIYSFIIGKFYPIKQLGYYTQGNKMCDMGVITLYGSIQSATFPIFSSIQNEPERLVRSYRKTIRFTSFLTFPIMMGLIIVAPSVFRLLLKEEWWPAIPFFQWLCAGGCFTILTAVNNNFIKVSGRSDGILKLEYFKVVITVIALVVTLQFTVQVMVIGLVITRLFVYLINMIYTARFTGYFFRSQLSDLSPYLLLATAMSAFIFPLKFIISNDLFLILAQITGGILIYLALSYLCGSKILMESFELLFKRNKKV